MTEPAAPRYADRMFPAPTDHGIARDDRAMSSVRNGTDVEEIGGAETESWYHGGGRIGERPVESIVVYPPMRGVRTQGDSWEPVKIGVLIDMDNGQLIYDWINATILAVEDALNEGVYDRPVEIRVVDARGLPRENYRKVRAGYQKLVEDGCVVIAGPEISDNAINLMEVVEEPRVPVISWTCATRFAGEYCFTVANGDIAGEAVVGAHWCRGQGHMKVGFFWEKGSSGTDYADFFRDAAAQNGPRSCSIRTPTRGPRAWRAGTASISSARTAPTRTTRRCSSASRPGSGGCRATSWWRWPTTRRGSPSTASPTPPWPSRARSSSASRRSRDADHQRRAGHLHHLQRLRPPRLQGRLHHHPRAARRRAALKGYYRPQWTSNTTSPLLAGEA